jgi:spore germination cell wall hydrolase CwlJ-like protein
MAKVQIHDRPCVGLGTLGCVIALAGLMLGISQYQLYRAQQQLNHLQERKTQIRHELTQTHQSYFATVDRIVSDLYVGPSRPTFAVRGVSRADLRCMTENIYHEARNQSLAGQIAVAMVTLNRVQSSQWPNTVCGVVYQGSLRGPQARGCQFSWTCDGTSQRVANRPVWDRIHALSETILGYPRDQLIDITNGATHYHADYVNPAWAKRIEFVTRIDNHLFYRYHRAPSTASAPQ